MSTRREALRSIAAAATLPVLHAQNQSAAKPAQAGFFTPDDLRLLSKLVDAIIPRTETPGASDAGVPLYIDHLASANKEVATALVKGLRELRGAGFADASAQRTVQMLTALNDSSDAFFRLVKDLTIDGYYSSREGLVTELG